MELVLQYGQYVGFVQRPEIEVVTPNQKQTRPGRPNPLTGPIFISCGQSAAFVYLPRHATRLCAETDKLSLVGTRRIVGVLHRKVEDEFDRTTANKIIAEYHAGQAYATGHEVGQGASKRRIKKELV